MSESHKYYYMKLKETFFNDSKILLLEQMPERFYPLKPHFNF